jgi:hypothetical protein
VTKGISRKDQRADQRRKRDQLAAGLALGAKKPPRGIPIPTKPSRPPVGAPSHYPVRRGIRKS